MDIRQYTDERYVPISDLSQMGDSFVASTQEYRQQFMEMVPIDEFEFVSIVETPSLVKKRFEKNVELKGHIKDEAESNDFILLIAKRIVKGEEINGLSEKQISSLKKRYEQNGKDLTIITSWLVNNYEVLIQESKEDISHTLPELNENDLKFINKFNAPESNYSITDYTSLNSSSYETGRRALEKLTRLKLYTKTKLGKKFVYKPTNKLTQMKGGK